MEIMIIVHGGKILIYDNNEENVLTLSKTGISKTEHKDNFTSHRFYQYTKEGKFYKKYMFIH